ncbi:Uncharacterized protein SCF082_LOCUS5724 [Durusdinium trenchii]|uniref:Uncharacterized protein n=1 Tax=Durusdinium trenchii TaxID=1381693 RepID=A0ABP0I8N8_9DINO
MATRMPSLWLLIPCFIGCLSCEGEWCRLGEAEELPRLQLLQTQISFRAPSDQEPNVILPKARRFPAPAPPPYAPYGEAPQPQLSQQAFIPSSAFLFGLVMCALGHRTLGMLAVYFAGQSSFALYMKLVLSEETISRELNLRGMPAAFLVTAIQQVVAFISLGLLMLLLYFSPQPYLPRQIRTWRETGAVLFFALAVAVNIGLNNFSMSLLPVSLNMVIRSCIPLVTLLLQQLACRLRLLEGCREATFSDALLMSLGVAGAAVTALAESEGNEPSQHGHLWLGVLMCCLGDLAAATTLILAAAFSSTLKPPLTPLDTVFYTALPCALALLPASLYASHPINWPDSGTLTDWQVYQRVHQLSPGTIFLVIFSGVVSAGYNFIQYTVVQTLSATHAAFAGNFNKAATISLSMCLGLEILPSGRWSSVMILGICGNILAFTLWSYLQALRMQKEVP